jgi:hypothetical protein
MNCVVGLLPFSKGKDMYDRPHFRPHFPVADHPQWEILHLGPGYSIRRVRDSIACRIRSDEAERR